MSIWNFYENNTKKNWMKMTLFYNAKIQFATCRNHSLAKQFSSHFIYSLVLNIKFPKTRPLTQLLPPTPPKKATTRFANVSCLHTKWIVDHGNNCKFESNELPFALLITLITSVRLQGQYFSITLRKKRKENNLDFFFWEARNRGLN